MTPRLHTLCMHGVSRAQLTPCAADIERMLLPWACRYILSLEFGFHFPVGKPRRCGCARGDNSVFELPRGWQKENIAAVALWVFDRIVSDRASDHGHGAHLGPVGPSAVPQFAHELRAARTVVIEGTSDHDGVTRRFEFPQHGFSIVNQTHDDGGGGGTSVVVPIARNAGTRVARRRPVDPSAGAPDSSRGAAFIPIQRQWPQPQSGGSAGCGAAAACGGFSCV